jgi:hypothetical protein
MGEHRARRNPRPIRLSPVKQIVIEHSDGTTATVDTLGCQKIPRGAQITSATFCLPHKTIALEITK